MDHHEPISPEALKLLLASHAEFLSFLERRVGSGELAEELLQQAYVRGIERGGAIGDDACAVAWFYRLLRNALVDHVRRSGAAGRALRRLAGELEGSHGVDEPRRPTACACVSKLLGTLKPEYEAALRTVDIEGKSLGDFAKQVGITANNAAVRLHRARSALGDRVRTSCGACASDGACLDCDCV